MSATPILRKRCTVSQRPRPPRPCLGALCSRLHTTSLATCSPLACRLQDSPDIATCARGGDAQTYANAAAGLLTRQQTFVNYLTATTANATDLAPSFASDVAATYRAFLNSACGPKDLAQACYNLHQKLGRCGGRPGGQARKEHACSGWQGCRAAAGWQAGCKLQPAKSMCPESAAPALPRPWPCRQLNEGFAANSTLEALKSLPPTDPLAPVQQSFADANRQAGRACSAGPLCCLLYSRHSCHMRLMCCSHATHGCRANDCQRAQATNFTTAACLCDDAQPYLACMAQATFEANTTLQALLASTVISVDPGQGAFRWGGIARVPRPVTGAYVESDLAVEDACTPPLPTHPSSASRRCRQPDG